MSISERRIERLLNPDMNEGLPAFLARHPGMESGFMIAHVAAAALLNEAKVLAHPSSIDNVPTSAGKEDHVAMGMTGALKLRTIAGLAENLLAIELLAAAEALEHRRPLKAGVGVERAFAAVRKIAPPLTQDRSLSERHCARGGRDSPRRILTAATKRYERKTNHSRAARRRAKLQRLASGSGHADVDEQSRS